MLMRFAHGPETIKLGDLEVRTARLRRDAPAGQGRLGRAGGSGAAHAVLRRAIELGINLIDTAWYYGPHVANRLIARRCIRIRATS